MPDDLKDLIAGLTDGPISQDVLKQKVKRLEAADEKYQTKRRVAKKRAELKGIVAGLKSDSETLRKQALIVKKVLCRGCGFQYESPLGLYSFYTNKRSKQKHWALVSHRDLSVPLEIQYEHGEIAHCQKCIKEDEIVSMSISIPFCSWPRRSTGMHYVLICENDMELTALPT